MVLLQEILTEKNQAQALVADLDEQLKAIQKEVKAVSAARPKAEKARDEAGLVSTLFPHSSPTVVHCFLTVSVVTVSLLLSCTTLAPRLTLIAISAERRRAQ